MNYFEALKQRSLILRRGLTGTVPKGLAAPVYIDLRTEERKRPSGKQDAPAEKTGASYGKKNEPRKEPPQKQEREAVLLGIEEAERAAKRAESTREMPQRQLPAVSGQEAPEARLLHRIRRAERRGTVRPAREALPVLKQEPALRLPGPEDWSDRWEQDARRYDGGFEPL